MLTLEVNSIQGCLRNWVCGFRITQIHDVMIIFIRSNLFPLDLLHQIPMILNPKKQDS